MEIGEGYPCHEGNGDTINNVCLSVLACLHKTIRFIFSLFILYSSSNTENSLKPLYTDACRYVAKEILKNIKCSSQTFFKIQMIQH